MKTHHWPLLVLAGLAFAAHAQKMDARWDELMKLVQVETEMLEKANKKGDEVHYRLLELYSERLKLVLERENKAFLEAQDGKKHARKDAYFSESLRLYSETRGFGEQLLKAYPDSPRRGAMYYALALNSRDYGRDRRTEAYLLEALKLIRPGQLFHHAETSLADFYYNEKRFPEAIQYYERVVRNEGDDWKPKHHLNLGWCYVKANRFDDGIRELQAAYRLSQDSRYVDIREQALTHLAPFFVFAGRVEDGRAFYVKNEADPLPYLLSLAKRAADKGHRPETEVILKTMQQLIDKKGLMQHQESLLLYELDFQRGYQRWEEHLATSRKLLGLHRLALAQPDKKWVSERDAGIEKVRGVAGFLQLSVAKDVKKGGHEYAGRDLKRTVAYFELLRELDAERKDEYAYFIGETHYAVNQYEAAAKAYRLALEDSLAQAKPSVELQRKILNSLLALTGEEVLAAKSQRETLIYTYGHHVLIFPKDEMSLKLYPKLFTLHREDGRDTEAVAAIERYHQHYPAELAAQQELMKALMDDFIKAKAVLKITHWIGEFKKGFLKFDAKTIEQTEIILGQILFVTATELLARGERHEALKIFADVYKTTLYPHKVRALAGIQAADLQLDLATPGEAIAWIEKAMELLADKDLADQLPRLTTMLERMAYMREFRGAVRMTDALLKKSCAHKTAAQERLWELSVNFHLVLADDGLTARHFRDSAACATSKARERKMAGHILEYYWDHNDPARLMSFWRAHHGLLERDEYVDYLLDLYWDQGEEQQRALRLELQTLKTHPRVVSLMDEFRQQEAFHAARAQVLSTVLLESGKPFDGEAFNARLEAFLLSIKRLGEEVKPLLSSEHGKIREQANQQLLGFYTQVVDRLHALHPGEGEDAEFIASFQSEMHKIAQVFRDKAHDFKQGGRRPSGDVTFASPVQPAISTSTMDQLPGGRP